jgi:phosphotransferase system  glucose/maltose/N-acetylglucosamine-specific IIC component
MMIVNRIDDNVTTSLANVTSAHEELWKVWRGVSGNRKLILQMFLVLIVFAILFLVFFV